MSQQAPAVGTSTEEPLWSEGPNLRNSNNEGNNQNLHQGESNVGDEGHRNAENENQTTRGASAEHTSETEVRAEAVSEPTIEELVSKAVINLNEACRDLPQLRPQELKIIGRCVTFVGETTLEGERTMFHYEGLVGMISKDTVVLLHTSRYTEDDFNKLRAQRLREDAENAVQDTDPSAKKNNEDIADDECEKEASALDKKGVNIENGIDCFVPTDPEGRENSAVSGSHFSRHGRHLGNGSVPPVPYMTFSRRRIHKVEFGRDPRSAFYSLFRDPSRRHFDMQCLRMFVRRYLVHTSQGNNPRNISLRPFVTCRTNCKTIDDNLLICVAKEELAHLVKTEREIVLLAERNAQSRRNVFRTYRAPNGLFQATGILFLTKIPMQTFCLAIMQILFTIFSVGYSSYSISAASPVVIYGYVKGYTVYVTLSGILSALTGGFTLFHSLRMSLPFRLTLLSVLRFVLVTASIGVNIMMVITAGEAVSFSHIRDYLVSLVPGGTELCIYYLTYNCSGFFENCDGTTSSPLCDVSCSKNSERSCTNPLSTTFTRMFVPMVVLSMVLIALFFIDHFLHYRLLHVSRLLMTQM